MLTPGDAEIAAMNEAGRLLRYAAEHIPDLDPDLSLAIAEAMQAKRDQQWTPTISQRFWSAFSRLCDLIKPATMESLAAAEQNVESRSWIRIWRQGRTYSLAERTSSRYLVLLFWLLVIITSCQLYVWVSANMSKQLDDLIVTMTAQAGQLAREDVALSSNGNGNDPKFQEQATKLMEDSQSLADVAERSQYYIDILSMMWSFRHNTGVVIAAPPQTLYWTDWYPYATKFVQVAKTQALSAEGNANLISGIIASYVLPILFGTIGAVAYVIRAISDQIRNTTFTGSSPIRHVMRVMLGALMGAVIGLFSTLSAQINLSPLALAFLSGYGVEAVFSMFDGVVARFRDAPPDTAK
jgi:hypothetical protein